MPYPNQTDLLEAPYPSLGSVSIPSEEAALALAFDAGIEGAMRGLCDTDICGLISGLTIAIGAGLSVDLAAGYAIINGIFCELLIAANIASLPANEACVYIFATHGSLPNGAKTMTFSSSISGALPANSILLATCVTGAATVTSVDNAPANRPPQVGSLTDGDKGDITVSASGATWTIDNAAVSLAKMANLAQNIIIGRITASTGVPEALSAANVRTIINVADGANAYVHPNHSGEVTSVADGAQTIAAAAVTLAKMANLAANSIIGNNTGAPATPLALTAAQVKTLLSLDNVTNDAQVKASIGTAKGDIIGFSGNAAPVHLVVGANGTVLQAADGEALGIKWAAIAGTGDVTAAANLTDHALVRGDGGAKGVQTSLTTIDDYGQMLIIPSAADKIPFTIQGYAAQSGDLLRLQDSTPTILARFDSLGRWGFGCLPACPIDIAGSPTDYIRLTTASGATVYNGALVFRTSRGTLALPTASNAGDEIGAASFSGYGTTQYLTGLILKGIAAELFSNSAAGSYLELWIVPPTTINSIMKYRLKDVGLQVYNSASTSNYATLNYNSLAIGLDAVAATAGVDLGNLSYQTTRCSADAFSQSFIFRHARGTLASPTATQNADLLGNITFQGYGTSWVGGAQIKGAATQTHAAGKNGGQLSFWTTPNDSATAIQALTIDQDGSLAHLVATGKLGLFGVTPVARAAAYTQTYSTASRTVPNMTYAAPSGGATVDTQCRASLAQLAADLLAYLKVMTSLIDDSQGYGLAG